MSSRNAQLLNSRLCTSASFRFRISTHGIKNTIRETLQFNQQRKRGGFGYCPGNEFWECSSQQLCLVRFIGYSVHAWVSYSIYLSSRQSRGHTTVLRTKFNRFNMTSWCQHQWHHRCEQCNARGTRKNNHTGSHTCVRRISVKFFL